MQTEISPHTADWAWERSPTATVCRAWTKMTLYVAAEETPHLLGYRSLFRQVHHFETRELRRTLYHALR